MGAREARGMCKCVNVRVVCSRASFPVRTPRWLSAAGAVGTRGWCGGGLHQFRVGVGRSFCHHVLVRGLGGSSSGARARRRLGLLGCLLRCWSGPSAVGLCWLPASPFVAFVRFRVSFCVVAFRCA
jgi:hypothetical protein